MSSDNCCLLWRGKVYAGPALKKNGDGWEDGCSFANQNLSTLAYGGVRLPSVSPLGNISEFSISTAKQEFQSVDYTDDGDGCDAEIITDRTINFTINCFDKTNFDLAFGTKKVIRSSQTIVSEDVGLCGAKFAMHDVTPFGLAPINVKQSVTLVRYDTQTQASFAFVENVDYIKTIAGVEWLKPVTLSNTERLRASYTSSTTDSHEESNCSPEPLTLLFDGVNRVNGCEDRRIMAVFYRVKLKVGERFDMIHANGFFSAQISGRLETVNIAGKKKRFTIYPRVKT